MLPRCFQEPHIVPDSFFTEYKLNPFISLKNKLVMAPMTRAKATDNLIPTEAMAAYYVRRAGAGLIVTEGTVISADALGHKNVPGIFNQEQIHHWRRVTDDVHRHQGLMFMQLWHVGRVSHPSFLSGCLPISASATTMTSKIVRSEGLHYGTSRAATTDEIYNLVRDYGLAAHNAREAGCDGVEIHGANGYLIDQFLHYCTNQRDDEYGGSVDNRARFALEVVHVCGQAIGYERVGLRLSPGAYLNEMVGDHRDALVFQYLLEQLNDLPIAYVHTGNFNDETRFAELNGMTMTKFIRQHYRGTVIACGGYSYERSLDGLSNKEFDLVAMGRPFIANPDLVECLRENKPLRQYDVSMLNQLY